MANKKLPWIAMQELLDRGDPEFLTQFRQMDDAEFLGDFAARWHLDSRLQARKLLLQYLALPLNCFHHEAFVKRLFKLAEMASDDEVMAYFLVTLDESVRRRQKRVWMHQVVLTVPHSTSMPKKGYFLKSGPLDSKRLFSVHTRYYLRRRVWRYFRNIGKSDPRRYQLALSKALCLYENKNVADGLALLDNWGLMHVLFHHCPAIRSDTHGWQLAGEEGLSALHPAPIFPDVWNTLPPLLKLVQEAKATVVRQWAAKLIRKLPAAEWNKVPIETWLKMLEEPDSELAKLAMEVLRQSPELASISTQRWLEMLRHASPHSLELITELARKHVDRKSLTSAQLSTLTRMPAVPIARLGLEWLTDATPQTELDCELFLGLAQAESEAVRPDLLQLAQTKLSNSPLFKPLWLLEWFDSRFADVRSAAWKWYDAEPRAKTDVVLWQRMLESPYDDVKLRLIHDLEALAYQTPALWHQRQELKETELPLLWASVLLNTQRGNRTKPAVVKQLVERMEAVPADASRLLPLLAVAVRSVRGPEFRTGLWGITNLAERQPQLAEEIRKNFPEIQLQSVVA